MQTKLISITPAAEQHIIYCARASSGNQENPEIEALLKRCIQRCEWSIFESAHMTIEILATRNISRQLLRHKSFSFQEFSQRYSDAITFEASAARRQDNKNRQSSIDDLPNTVKTWWEDINKEHQQLSLTRYKTALSLGIAKEVARDLLPESTMTKLYMTGNIRSWIHYLQVRTEASTQLEHRVMAEEIRDIFIDRLPIIGAILWQTNPV